MKISIVGTGYVGLVTGAIFSDYGFEVHCIDINAERVYDMQHGKIPFYEPGLEDLVLKNVTEGTLHFTTNYADTVPHSDVVFICVGTPPLENGEVDLTQLTSATEMTAKNLDGYTVIAIKSTVPIGVEEALEEIIERYKKPEIEYEFASVPEFLREGSALEDTMHPDRMVFGVKTKKAADMLLDIHKHISGERVVTDLRTAQMIKYAANSFLAMKISFANGVANVAERVGANGLTVLHGMGLDKRIGHVFLKPGLGFGGSCFPKDVLAFYDIARKNGYEFSIVHDTYEMNLRQAAIFFDKIYRATDGVQGKTYAVLGLAFKPDTDDIRFAPALEIIRKLLADGAKVQAYDPIAMDNVKKVNDISGNNNMMFSESLEMALANADALVLCTEWDEFKKLDLAKAKELLKTPTIIDGRNIFNPQNAKDLGLTYIGVGR